MKLTQEEKRVKIVEACGWYVIQTPEEDGAKAYSLRHPTELTLYPWHESKEECFQDAPNYFHDLNDIHEAEKLIKGIGVPFTDDQAKEWFDHLIWVCYMDEKHTFTACATAAQRAEAFGLTLNLWEAGE